MDLLPKSPQGNSSDLTGLNQGIQIATIKATRANKVKSEVVPPDGQWHVEYGIK